MDTATQRKWDAASRNFDFVTYGDDQRLGPHKRRLFTKMHGAILMVAAGTGNDVRFFPPQRSITAIDISARMLEKAAVGVIAELAIHQVGPLAAQVARTVNRTAGRVSINDEIWRVAKPKIH
jgi:hypothetical protein